MKRYTLALAALVVGALLGFAVGHLSARPAGATSPIIIAVVDTGVQWEHQHFAHNQLVLPGWWDESYFVSAQDDHGHGTGVAGKIDRDVRAAGGAPGVPYIMPFKVCDRNAVCGEYFGDDDREIARAVRAAADTPNVRIIHAAIYSYKPLPQVQAAVDYATVKGILVVSIAGNSGLLSPEPDPSTVYPLGVSRNVLAVGGVYGAIHPDPLTVWEGSTLSPYVDVMAPAVGIAAPGCHFEFRATDFGPCPVTWDGTNYQQQAGLPDGTPVSWQVTGTSFAGPRAAALAYLLRTLPRAWCECADDAAYLEGTIKGHAIAMPDCTAGCGAGLLDFSGTLAAVGWTPPTIPTPTRSATPTVTATANPTPTTYPGPSCWPPKAKRCR